MWRALPFAVVLAVTEAQAQAVTLSDDDRGMVIVGVCAILFAMGLMVGKR